MENGTPSAETRYSFLFRLTGRFSAFLAGMLILTMLLYAAGNFQRFLDGTQELLLLASSVVSLVLIIFAAAGILECLAFGIAWRHRLYWLSLIPFLLCEVLGVALFAVSRLVITAAGGISA